MLRVKGEPWTGQVNSEVFLFQLEEVAIYLLVPRSRVNDLGGIVRFT